MRIFLLTILFCSLFTSYSNASDCVVLLHGLARSEHSLSRMAQKLSDRGYFVVNESYPSTDYDIETLANDIIPKSIVACPDSAQIHFVTHSLGGILVRQYLEDHALLNLGRVVMLAPPNKGSEITDEMKDNILYQTINGPAGLQLGTDSSSVPNLLGPATFELGIIAGTKTVNPILSQMLPNPDDGKVSVESTKLEGMSDHIEVPYSHTFIMNKDDVIDQVIHFLEHGTFELKDDKGSQGC
jgi:pimeloyl-ACP methyl ester carboxylesterase